ncbi:MAG: UDP-glucose 4-epimerase GalE [Cytophagales bacterium]|nr:UDP-glucose 4-epimerase GalE [Cytophagales bacterium]
MDNRILVTGGAGFIGSHTVVELIEAGFEPIIIDNFSNSYPFIISNLEKITGKKIKYYEVDCNDQPALEKVFEKEENINGVIHFAAFKAVGESVEQPLKYYRNNVASVITLLEVMAKYNVENLVFSSSCTVYGEPDELPVMEDSLVKLANSPYGNTKQVCEEILKDYVSSNALLKAIALRYFNPIGAHPSSLIGELPIGKPNNLIPFITQTAIGIRSELTVFGDNYETPDGSCIRDYIHVVDLAKAHVKAIIYANKQETRSFYDIFNVGTGQGNSVFEIIKAFNEASGTTLNYKIGPKRDGDVTQVYGDVSKSLKLLEWKTEKSLLDSLRDAWNWQKHLEKQNYGI